MHQICLSIILKEGTLVDAMIIEAPTFTKNKAKQRAPDIHQTKKGNQWYFGMKAHICVDARTGMTHSLSTTTTNQHDLNQSESNDPGIGLIRQKTVKTVKIQRSTKVIFCELSTNLYEGRMVLRPKT